MSELTKHSPRLQISQDAAAVCEVVSSEERLAARIKENSSGPDLCPSNWILRRRWLDLLSALSTHPECQNEGLEGDRVANKDNKGFAVKAVVSRPCRLVSNPQLRGQILNLTAGVRSGFDSVSCDKICQTYPLYVLDGGSLVPAYVCMALNTSALQALSALSSKPCC